METLSSFIFSFLFFLFLTANPSEKKGIHAILMDTEAQQVDSSNSKFKVFFKDVRFFLYIQFVSFILLQKFRKRIARPIIKRYGNKNKDEQQDTLLREKNKKDDPPIRNEDYEV